MEMSRPESLYEAASYDLNKFRERRMAERRATPRATGDRRQNGAPTGLEPIPGDEEKLQDKH
jgi:hypothetical protein